MRAIIQRVHEASVTVDHAVVGRITQGLLVLLGVGQHDTAAEAVAFAQKIASMRIFSDVEGRFNHSVLDTNGGMLVVSQFTLYADTRRGRRPSFTEAARPEVAEPLVETFCHALRQQGLHVETGVFGAHMHVALINDGPVTITLDSETMRDSRKA